MGPADRVSDQMYFLQQRDFELEQDASHPRCEASSDEEKTLPSPRAVSDDETEGAKENPSEEIKELEDQLKELYQNLAFCKAQKACWVSLASKNITLEINRTLAKIERCKRTQRLASSSSSSSDVNESGRSLFQLMRELEELYKLNATKISSKCTQDLIARKQQEIQACQREIENDQQMTIAKLSEILNNS